MRKPWLLDAVLVIGHAVYRWYRGGAYRCPVCDAWVYRDSSPVTVAAAHLSCFDTLADRVNNSTVGSDFIKDRVNNRTVGLYLVKVTALTKVRDSWVRDGAVCHFCSGPCFPWTTDDGTWSVVEPLLGQHQVCFGCFVAAHVVLGYAVDNFLVVRPFRLRNVRADSADPTNEKYDTGHSTDGKVT